jgi:hypothetical protein
MRVTPLDELTLREWAEKGPGEKITQEYISGRIADVKHFTHPIVSTLTICAVTLDNGFTVVGESACADPVNFNAELGRELAFRNAFQKLWPLFGFLLSESRYMRANEAAGVADIGMSGWKPGASHSTAHSAYQYAVNAFRHLKG